MKLIAAVLLFFSSHQKVQASEVVAFPQDIEVYIAGIENPILAAAMARLLTVAGEGHEYSTPYSVSVTRSLLLDVPNIPFYGMIMHVGALMQRCEIPELETSHLMDDFATSLQKGINPHELQKIVADNQGVEDARRARVAECTRPLRTDNIFQGCDARLELDYFNFFSPHTYTLSIDSQMCPALASFTDKTLSITFHKTDRSNVQFEDVVVQ